MATKRGAHSRPANQQGYYQQQPDSYQQQGGYQQNQGAYQQQWQGGQPVSQQPSSQRDAYDRAYRQYVGEQGANQRAQQQAAYQQAMRQRGAGNQQYNGYATYGAYGNAGGYQQGGMSAWQPTPKKKGHPVRNTFLVLLVILVIVGAVGGFTGYTLYQSAKVVKADASVVMSDISSLKDQVLAEQPDQANATAQDIAKRAANMKAETSGWAWTVASYVPVYGSDVAKVKELSVILDDLSTQAIVPLVSEVSQISIKNLLVDGSINVELAQRMVNAVNSAAPEIESAAKKIDKMGDAKLEQINGPLQKAREKLGKLNTATQFVESIAPTFADMVGADGSRRTYLIVAQNNSEIRSTGGFLGSIGPLYLDNGRIEMGDFRTIYDIYPDDNAPLTEEELAIFGRHVGYQIADSNFIPDFSRASEIVKWAWERKGYGTVDAVIGVDPVFLQQMLAIAGPITTSNGTVVDGSNAARILLHEAYYLPTEEQDPLFEEVAALSFAQVMSHLGDLSITKLYEIVKDAGNSRRLQVWMAADNEESAVEMLGIDGKLSHDATEPEVGIFFTDETYSKMFWYMKAETSVGEAVKNADGTTTYPVSLTYWNMLQDVNELSDYMKSHNSAARSPGELICWVYLSAPEGGSISNVVCTQGEFMPEGTNYRGDNEGSYVSGTMTEATLQGLDFWYGLSRTLPGDSFSLSFNVTVSSQASEPLKVVRTPTAQEVAGW